MVGSAYRAWSCIRPEYRRGGRRRSMHHRGVVQCIDRLRLGARRGGRGVQRNTLVTVLLEDVKPPLLFRQKQTLSLIDWDPVKNDPAPPLPTNIRPVQSEEIRRPNLFCY